MRLGSRIRRLVGDTAFVGVSAHADVTIFAPGGAPGVLDFPVGRRRVAVADNEDTVIQVLAANTAEDTAGVHLETSLVGLNGDRDWFNVIGSAQRVLIVRDINVASDLGVSRHGARAGLASAILAGVRVSGLSAQAVSLDVLEGAIHLATIAAHVAVRASAVNKLLLREGGQVAVLDLHNTLNTAGGGESPAGTAVALVLHTSDSALLNPVKGARGVGGGLRELMNRHDAGLARGAQLGLVAKVDVLELALAHVGELVEANSVGVVASVVLSNEVHPRLEGVIAVEEFFRGIGLLELHHPLGESLLVFLLRESGSHSKENEKTKDLH